jgi:hypothetical protein
MGFNQVCSKVFGLKLARPGVLYLGEQFQDHRGPLVIIFLGFLKVSIS